MTKQQLRTWLSQNCNSLEIDIYINMGYDFNHKQDLLEMYNQKSRMMNLPSTAESFVNKSIKRLRMEDFWD